MGARVAICQLAIMIDQYQYESVSIMISRIEHIEVSKLLMGYHTLVVSIYEWAHLEKVPRTTQRSVDIRA